MQSFNKSNLNKFSMKSTISILLVLFMFLVGIAHAEIKDVKFIENELAVEKAQNSNDLNHVAIIKDLEDTLIQLSNLSKLEQEQQDLDVRVKNADAQISESQNKIHKLKIPPDFTKYNAFSIDELHDQIENLNLESQRLQTDLNNISAQLVNQKSMPEKSQQNLTANSNEIQAINKSLVGAERDSEMNLLNTRLQYLEQDNIFIKMELKAREKLIVLYSSLDSEKRLELDNIQNELNYLQEQINKKRLEQSQQNLAQAKDDQNTKNYSDVVKAQLSINSDLSQQLVDATAQANDLSSHSLKIKKILDRLSQTQRNLEEQISSLEGTLVLSKVIEQQKKRIPTDSLIKGLANRISHIRVDIFELNEMEDKLLDIDGAIDDIQTNANRSLTSEEKEQIKETLLNRKNIIADTVKVLNVALSSAISIDLDQNQVLSISNSLENRLEQQSFWVKSNFPIDLDWIKNFPSRAINELAKIKSQIYFNNAIHAFTVAGSFIFFFVAIVLLLHWKTKAIRRSLLIVNSRVNVLSQDTQVNSLKAVILNLLLALKSTFLFFAILITVVVLTLKTPIVASSWIFDMVLYWLLFAFVVQALSPNGLCHRQFGMSEENAERFSAIFKRSFLIIAMFINCDLLTKVPDVWVADDVIGMLINIICLLLLLLLFIPLYYTATNLYTNERGKNLHLLFVLFKILAVVMPIVIIALICLGYYYTALKIIRHIILSFVIIILWLFISQMIYRMIRVASNRMAYRYHKKYLDERIENQKVATLEKVVKDINRLTGLLVWIGLLVGLYLVWADLIAVGYYLDNITLWHQSVVGSKGSEIESITLLNLLYAIVIIIGTVGLVRNIEGILEVLIFSRIKLAQGSPYTITTLTSYVVIAIGAGWAFSSLGMSWSKLQWLFAALSVGLGFGLQEIFANFISGLIILFERPVRIGDAITIGEYTGTVSKIRIRATTVVDYNRKEVIIPNKAFVTERFTNWALSNTMTRIPINFSFAYESDLVKIKELLLQVAHEAEFVLDDPEPKVYFLGISASTFDYTLYVFVAELGHRHPTTDFVYNRAAELFRIHNIEMAFAQMDVYIKNKDDNPYSMKIVKDEDKPQIEEGEIVTNNDNVTIGNATTGNVTTDSKIVDNSQVRATDFNEFSEKSNNNSILADHKKA